MWGQPVIVENRAGAGGTIGAGVVAKSPPDGYTLLVHSAAHAVNPSIYPTLPYDTLKDFVEVAPLGGQPNVLVVAPSTGLQDASPTSSPRRRRSRARSTSRSAGIGSGTHINAREIQARGRHRRRAHPVQGHAGGDRPTR